MDQIKAIIVEDERASRETLTNYLGKYCPEVSLQAAVGSVKEGIAAINEHQPELVFLDVEMPYGNAFDLLEEIKEINFDTIFVTAFSHYAMKALNFSASYYLLKPVDIDELIAAVQKVIINRKEAVFPNHTQILVENMQKQQKQSHKVVMPLIDGFEVVQVGEIVRCKAEDNFTNFYLKDGTKRLICRTLKFYDELLSDFDFIRVHKSHLVNFHHIKKYHKGKGGELTLSDGSVVSVATSRKKDLLSYF